MYAPGCCQLGTNKSPLGSREQTGHEGKDIIHISVSQVVLSKVSKPARRDALCSRVFPPGWMDKDEKGQVHVWALQSPDFSPSCKCALHNPPAFIFPSTSISYTWS